MASSKNVKMIDCTAPGCTEKINFSRKIKLCPKHLHHRDLCTCSTCKKLRTRRAALAEQPTYREPYKPQNPWEMA